MMEVCKNWDSCLAHCKCVESKSKSKSGQMLSWVTLYLQHRAWIQGYDTKSEKHSEAGSACHEPGFCCYCCAGKGLHSQSALQQQDHLELQDCEEDDCNHLWAPIRLDYLTCRPWTMDNAAHGLPNNWKCRCGDTHYTPPFPLNSAFMLGNICRPLEISSLQSANLANFASSQQSSLR